jgi:putative hydrolase of the HAD superfamily
VHGPLVTARRTPPRAVLFDLYNTLVPGGDDLRRQVAADMAAVIGVTPDAMHDAIVSSARERFTGALGDLAATYTELARRLGVDAGPAAIAGLCELRLALTRGLLSQPSPAAVQVLRRLRAAGWSVGLVSNATAETPALWFGMPLAPLVDATAFSCEAGLAKPDPAIYLDACARLGVAPEDCVYVGDGADHELPAAASLGMTVIRTTEFADTAPSWPGPSIPVLTALPDLITERTEPPTAQAS